MLNKLYINKKTYEVLEGVIPKGIDWVEIPDEAVTAYYFDGTDPDGYAELVFYNSLEQIYYGDRWETVFNDSISYRNKWGKVVWERGVGASKQEAKPIKSDGGSSDYYKRDIPELMLERWKEEGVIEAKDVMKLFLGNDYNFCNSFKAHCRVQSLREGVGKDGADEKYDLRKAWFFCEDAYNDYLERGEINE